jgi:hypothetical protein
MKLALSFFLAVLVVMSHQQFQRNPYHMMFDAFPWLSPLPRYPVNPAFYYDYETATVSIPSNLKVRLSISNARCHLSCYCAEILYDLIYKHSGITVDNSVYI